MEIVMRMQEGFALHRKTKEKSVNRLVRFSEILDNIGLDLNWATAILALSAQEVAVKKKLDEVGGDYGEKDEFQSLCSALEKAYQKENQAPPLILLSISRSYRHIRAKLVHEGHKYKVSEEEAKSILNNTKALIDNLFVEPRLELKSVEAIRNLSEKEISSAVKKVASDQIIRTMRFAIDEISKLETFDYSDSQDYEEIGYLIKAAIREREGERIQLFEMFLKSFFPTTMAMTYTFVEKVSQILAELVKIVSIRNWIVENKYVDMLISELAQSRSFDLAGINTDMILGFLPHLSEEQLTALVDFSISNDQIYCSYKAKRNLKTVLDFCEGKIKERKLDELRMKIEHG
jgi:hypothetical protein